jgi:hypothetical protein
LANVPGRLSQERVSWVVFGIRHLAANAMTCYQRRRAADKKSEKT